MTPRLLALAALLLLAPPALAQTTTQARAAPRAMSHPAASSAEIARVSHLLAANWRPVDLSVTGGQAAILGQACDGALAEMQALDATLPADLTAASLANIRAPHGLVLVPSDYDPAQLYIFPNAQLADIASGPGAFTITDAAQGQIVLHDAAGHDTQLQLGHSSTAPLLRILRPNAAPLLYVACASSTG